MAAGTYAHPAHICGAQGLQQGRSHQTQHPSRAAGPSVRHARRLNQQIQLINSPPRSGRREPSWRRSPCRAAPAEASHRSTLDTLFRHQTREACSARASRKEAEPPCTWGLHMSNPASRSKLWRAVLRRAVPRCAVHAAAHQGAAALGRGVVHLVCEHLQTVNANKFN